jgi:hypothetical protein
MASASADAASEQKASELFIVQNIKSLEKLM